MYQINWGDLSAETFINEYWQKKPLLIRRAFTEMEPVLEGDELAGLALEEQVESRLIRFDPRENNWQMQRGPLDEALFAQLPESNWTLLVQAVDHYSEAAQELLDAFSFLPRWRIDDLMISYATPGGGVGPHYDNYDVFLIQASGTRRWELGEIEDSASPRVAGVPVMILSDFAATQSFDLEPGDMLYLPPQLAHNGIATSADCITYSVGFRAPSEAELLRGFSDFVGETLGAEQRYTDADLKQPATNSGEIDPQALQRVQQTLTRLLSNPEQLSHWFGALVTDPKYPDELYRPEEDEFTAWLEQFDPDEGVGLLGDARAAYIEGDDGLKLFVNGQRISVKPSEQAWIRRLCNERHSGPIALNSSSKSLLKRLFLSGAI